MKAFKLCGGKRKVREGSILGEEMPEVGIVVEAPSTVGKADAGKHGLGTPGVGCCSTRSVGGLL